MIRMVVNTSAEHAKKYFSDALSKADYFINDQELQGRFSGRLMERLGLDSVVTKDDFFALCSNINPKTGNSLTPCTKEGRRVGYDINFHCPKSVSVLHALCKDDHILTAFQDAVSATMKEIEADALTRVRRNGAQEDRKTGELLWATFDHFTARPVDGHLPDPHLHSHCFVFNATWDEAEQKYKAGQFGDIKRDMPYYQSRFHKRLSDKMMDAGYQIRRTKKYFEIEGVPQRVIDLFSKRTDEIGRIAKEQGITDAKQLDKLGALTRSAKQKGLTMSELKEGWRIQIETLGKDDAEGEKPIRFAPNRDSRELSPQQCIDHSLSHSFERASVMAERRLLAQAYRHGIGSASLSLDDITSAFDQDTRIIHVQEKSQTLCTTVENLREEKHMVELARQGIGAVKPLYVQTPEISLDGQQADAIGYLLTNANRVSIIRGAAGAGKTTLLKEADRLIQQTGQETFFFAPTASASRGVLKDEGFKNADTVARLLVDQSLQDRLHGQTIFIDEAGLLGNKEMTSLLKIADKQNARLILIGDTRQHAAVVRGDALRILNTVGGIKTAEVNHIRRQRDIHYREAVQDLSKGNVKDGFHKLDNIGAIKATDPMQPNKELIEDYIQVVKKGKSALVVSPTHKQGEEVTHAIRDRLREAGLIGKRELAATKYSNLNLTAAEKTDWRNYQERQLVQFSQNVKGAKRGSMWSVSHVEDKQVHLVNQHGKALVLPQEKSDCFDLYNKTEISLSKGDKVTVTRNSFDQHDRRMDNGQSLEVTSINKQGKIILRNPQSKGTYVLDKEFGHLAHAHCVTSHASQGKTVDEVFVSQPAETFSATDAKQFYVSVSRARDKAHIYTDDREALLHHASQLGDRQSALELVSKRDIHREHMEQQHREDYELNTPAREPEKEHQPFKVKIDRDYEL